MCIKSLDQFKKEVRHIAWLSFEFAFLWFFSNYFYNAGLGSTSVSSSTVLSNTSSIFVYIMGLAMLPGVTFDKFKALMVLMSFGGIVIITLADTQTSTNGQNSFHGNILSLLGALFYGLYATILKKRVPEEEEETFRVSYFLGFVGLFNSILLIPFFFILNATKIETFELPNKQAFLALTANAILGTVISDYCWAQSVVLLGPLMTTLGIALTIPVSMIVDSFYEHKHFSWAYFLGTALIFGSFLGLSIKDYYLEKNQ